MKIECNGSLGVISNSLRQPILVLIKLEKT